MLKRIVAAIAAIASLAGCGQQTAATERYEYQFGKTTLALPDWLETEDLYCMEMEELGYDVGLYNPDELTAAMLSQPSKETIVERCIGRVDDEKGNGTILNTDTDDYTYISYKNVKGAAKDSIVLTYFMYGGENEDDIIRRDDFIIDTQKR